jgi:hypothetical protein
LTTPIGPPLLSSIQASLNLQNRRARSTGPFHRGSGKPSPASRDAATGSLASHVIRKGSFDTARATSRRARPFCYCTVVEIATHPIVRVIEVDRRRAPART